MSFWGAGQLLALAAATRHSLLVMCRYDEFGRLKRKYREGGAAEDRRAKEAAALARLHGSSGVSSPLGSHQPVELSFLVLAVQLVVCLTLHVAKQAYVRSSW